MNPRDATIALNMIPGIGPIRVNQLLSVLGSPEHILSADQATLRRVAGIGEDLAQRITGWRDAGDLDEEKQRAERAGVTIVTRQDPDYPTALNELRDPPLCLYVRGRLQALSTMNHAIAVVGSRRTTRYGVRMAKHLAGGAAFAGWTIVSGLARGIDSIAHQATLDANACTVAVLGSGLGRVYPQENLDLARQIVEAEGALVSEFPMMFPPDKRTFPMRNRIIAGMTRGTVVVEAGLKSGSLITANLALDQGRQVFAVPGPVDSPQSRGCHQLIKDGATLAETFADVAEGLTLLFPGLPREPVAHSRSQPQIEPSAQATPELEGIQRKVFDWIGGGEASVDELIAGVQEPPAQVLSAVVQLEMKRLVRQLPGKRVCRTENAQPA
ncbi:MAG: DNA-processing protein DprA [Verrucomicrobiota bacterium]